MSQDREVIDLTRPTYNEEDMLPFDSEDEYGFYSETPDSLSEDLTYEDISYEGEFEESSNSSFEVKVKVYNGA